MSSTPVNIDRILVIVLGACLAAFGAYNLVNIYFGPTPQRSTLQSVGSTTTPTPPPVPDVEIRHKEPLQESIQDPKTFSYKGYEITELARFRADAVVLSKAAYSATSSEHRGVLAPYDFAIGWGPMSNPRVLQNFSYFQKNRFFYYATYQDFSQESDRLNADAHIANVHLIPASEDIASALGKIEPRDIVLLEGSLIEVQLKGQSVWKSSLSRTDVGDGACELLFVTRVAWTTQPADTKLVPLPEPPDSDQVKYAPTPTGPTSRIQ